MRFHSNPDDTLADPVWNKNDPEFNERISYPWPEVMKTPEECGKAIDWVISHIVDLYDDPIVEKQDEYRQWYDYVWGKTWTVRRQIIQMRWNDLASIGIMERCARFHIFSAHAFVDFPEGYFVPKINFEHVGKILVGLRDRYSELNRCGIHCSNESEFMCYYLIHFPTSYKDASEFPEAVRNSKPLQFACKFLSALNSGNFVAFFNLVKEATYLQACLMHRHFVTMRTKTFYVLCKAYRARKELPVKVKMNVINSLLAFEDDTECKEYLRCFNIKFSDSHVIFDKDSFRRCFPRPIVRRSQVIERLRQDRFLSDIVNGGEGRLIPLNAERTFSKPKHPEFERIEKTIEKILITDRVAEGIWKGIITSVISSELTEVYNKLKYPFGVPDYCDQPSETSIVSKLDGSMNVSDAEIVLDSKEDEAKRRQEEKHLKTLLPKSLRDDSSGKGSSESSQIESSQTSSREQESTEESVEEAQEIVFIPVQESEFSCLNEPQKPQCLFKFVRPRKGINFARAEQKFLEETQTELNPSIQKDQKDSQELSFKSQQETGTHREAVKGLDDSDLIISDDDTPKPLKSRPQKAIRATLATVLRAIARINEKRST